MTKTEKRIAAKNRLKEIEDKQSKSVIICEKLFCEEIFLQAESIFVYLSTEDEVSTEGIVQRCFSLNKRVFVPITEDRMRPIEIFRNTDFVLSKYGIREPKERNFEGTVIDLIVVPMVAFDRNKNRMGHGKGFYDRYLQEVKSVKIGLAFSGQEFDKIEVDSYDVKMDMIITEKETIR